MIAIQYLEDSPDIGRLDVRQVVDKLRKAADILPISHVLIGWSLPDHLLERCRKAAETLGMRFISWYPLLTPGRLFEINPDWQVVGLDKHKLSGYRGIPGFTFLCPNHPDVQEAVLSHLEKTARLGLYQGFFFDRVRFPSPASNPLTDLGCFCQPCHQRAAREGLDLEILRDELQRNANDVRARQNLVNALLSSRSGAQQSEISNLIDQFIDFRKHSVTDFLAQAVRSLDGTGLEIGLDCFSPSLTRMVGQDLVHLSEMVDWVKVMTYAHTFSPAGIPFELSGLLRFLSSAELSERQALDWISQSLDLPLPQNRVSLEADGLSAIALESEVLRAVTALSVPVLAGIELVELEGITRLNPIQIEMDLLAIKGANPAGLALSWDLRHIRLDNLRLVRRAYYGD
jgi:Putative glycosyl hydrolase domain